VCVEITDILEQVWNVTCIGCAIASGEMTPSYGMISENDSFCLHQDPEVPIPGFLILASRKHVQSIADFTENECADFTSLLYRGRRLLNLLPGVNDVTIVQEERSSHFHCWLFPWYHWMIEKWGSNSLDHVRSITAYAKSNRVSDVQTQAVLEAVSCLKKEQDKND
jgi:diadenosine tetraphosphate (Ap4A) HIT family hydrolase